MSNKPSNRVLITGGAGFLGLHVAKRFAAAGWQCVLVDIQPYHKQEYPQDACLFLQVDVRDKRAMEVAMKGCDAVVHAAAALPLWSRRDIMTTNVFGTRNVIELAMELSIPRTVYISSTAVYGVPEKHPIVETDTVHGVGAYGESKIAAEEYCFSAMELGYSVTIIRPKTFIGTHRLGVFEILFDWIHDHKKIPVVGSGNNKYQLMDVEDLADALYIICSQNKQSFTDVFNIGAAAFGTVKQDFSEFFERVNSSSSLLPTPAAPLKITLRFLELLNLSPLYQWVYETADKDSFVSIDKICTTLNWKPKSSNADALVKSYEWYQQNYDAVKSRGSGLDHTRGWKQGVLGIVKWFL